LFPVFLCGGNSIDTVLDEAVSRGPTNGFYAENCVLRNKAVEGTVFTKRSEDRVAGERLLKKWDE